MNTDVKWNENNWHKNILAFHNYLNQTVETLADQKKIIRVETVPSNPRKAVSGKRIPVAKPVISEVKLSEIVPLVQTEKERVKMILARARASYSSPLWIGLGDENPGKSNTPKKRNAPQKHNVPKKRRTKAKR